MGQQQLQQLSQELQELEQQIEALEGEVESLRQEKTEIDEATDALETLESGSTVQVPLGGGAFLRATIEDIDEAIVELGANYAAEFEQDGAVDALESKKELVDEQISELNDEVTELEAESQQLEQQAQQMQQQAMQQQMQQMGQQGQPDADE
ncbi:prefoldin subunit alpha [Natronolimnobius sp. AArcel1]|uniref:prefoldin subunit alpha n=1 Tax=Natronolimnobius sp. AArcel1 TaxID=1679093 RepID=UPI0013EA1A7C|nr:prefoldin subunit alpha [Natronolimnobius sp. AArcel1]NGM70077.1 prefoldin subunit alpha [Natronolimnobius sp. AArcel1]